MKYLPVSLFFVAACFALPSFATAKTRFAVTNLNDLSNAPFTIPGKTFDRITERDRLTLGCTNCADMEGIDIIISKSTDGTEGRYRAGTTTIADIERICKSREPNCRVEAVTVHGAVGWVTRTTLFGRMAVSTTVLFKNGDMLTIRSFSDNAEIAYSNGQAARDQLAPQIVGPN
jgi:hypothetical protein